MVKTVIKRNGKAVPFDESKIQSAVEKAMAEIGFKDKYLARVISLNVRGMDQEEMTVEEIQDVVEEYLAKVDVKLARVYIRYRYDREKDRAIKSGFNERFDEIRTLIAGTNEEANKENSNKDTRIASVMRDYIAGFTCKEMAKGIIPADILEAHNEGIIHFHDADYSPVMPIHNCFHSSTRFVTKSGVKSFKDCRDGQEVTVLDKDGIWREAVVHKYDKQAMNIVTLRSGRSTKDIVCTSNHRWILKDGLVTTNLKIGDVLYPLHDIADEVISDRRFAEMFCLGFVIGDGNDTNGGMRARLCGEVKREHRSLFEKAGYHIGKIKDSDDFVCEIRGSFSKQNFLNFKGWKYLSDFDKKNLFLGLYASDGSKNRNFITTSDERVLDMIQDISAIAGYHIASVKKIVHDTNYKKNAFLYNISFRKHQNINNLWKVEGIKRFAQGQKYDAWCVEEPVTHSFTLDGGIVTGNCELINLEDMLQNGTVINGTMIEKPHSFRTACTITSQISALVASSSYGGQTINLAHLAPFVDISRSSIRAEVLEEVSGLTVVEQDVEAIIEKRLKKEISQGIQTLYYQWLTLNSTNGQAPFVTLFMYIDDLPKGRTRDDLVLLIEEVIRQRIKGVKNKKGAYVTTAFPKLIYVLDENNIHEGSEYWWLTKLCAECTAKRLVPDYVSAKKMKELKEGNVVAPMGNTALCIV